AGKEEQYLENLTSCRAALLLVTPQNIEGEIEGLSVDITLEVKCKTIEMRMPENLFKADRPESESNGPRPDVRYTKRAFSAIIPQEWVQPGMELTVTDNENRQGTLSSSDID